MLKRYLYCFGVVLLWLSCVHAEEAARPDAEEMQEAPVPAPEERPASSPAAVNAAPIVSAVEDKISLDLKGMDIVDVLKMLATRSGLNIVVGKDVTGRVALFLKNVDIWDAFEIILLANDLAYEKTGDIINVMTQRSYELLHGERFKDNKEMRLVTLKHAKAAGVALVLNQLKTPVGKVIVDEGSNTVVMIETPEKLKAMEAFVAGADVPLETKVFDLNYASADKVSVKIKEVLTNTVGSMKVDERTNKIAVTDTPSKVAEIEKLLTAFDEKTPQVLIDAQIVEVKPSNKFEMGVDWEYWIRKNFRATAALPVGTSERLFLGTQALTKPNERGEYKAILDILKTIGDTKVLSSPRITALNNQEAKILVGTKDAYITSTVSQTGTASVTSQSVNFVDVGIKLYVTPTINRDGFVTMKIRPEVSSAERTSITSEGKITQIPIVTTSETETTVMVKDGVTIIIGGLRKDEKSKTVKKIPLLGDIPVLGYLFKSTSDEFKKTDLVIFLTPHIISGENSLTDFSQAQPKDGVVFSMSKDGRILEDKNGPTGRRLKGEAALTSSEGDVSDYRALVEGIVKILALSDAPKDERGRVEASFSLDAHGRLKGAPKILSSSNKKLNKITLHAIEEAAPFPAFPESIGGGQESFRIILNYK